MTERISRLASSPARSRLKVCFSRPHEPATMEMPRPSRLLPMIDPVMVALTTAPLPDRSTNSARMNSAALPKVTFSRPPMAGPARSATCSVARRIHPLNGMMAAAAVANTHSGAACISARASDSGTSTSSATSDSGKCLVGVISTRGFDESGNLFHVFPRFRKWRYASVLRNVADARIVTGKRQGHAAAMEIQQTAQVLRATHDVLAWVEWIFHPHLFRDLRHQLHQAERPRW